MTVAGPHGIVVVDKPEGLLSVHFVNGNSGTPRW